MSLKNNKAVLYKRILITVAFLVINVQATTQNFIEKNAKENDLASYGLILSQPRLHE